MSLLRMLISLTLTGYVEGCFEWAPEKVKLLQKLQSLKQVPLPAGPYDLTIFVLLEVFIVNKDIVWNL